MFIVRSRKDTINYIQQFYAGLEDKPEITITKQVKPDPKDPEMVTVVFRAKMKKADLPAFLAKHAL